MLISILVCFHFQIYPQEITLTSGTSIQCSRMRNAGRFTVLFGGWGGGSCFGPNPVFLDVFGGGRGLLGGKP